MSKTLEMVYNRPQKPREDQKYQKSLESPLFISKIWQEIFTASLFWTGFKPKKPKLYKSITFKQRIFY
jgi:hypothetical protein